MMKSTRQQIRQRDLFLIRMDRLELPFRRAVIREKNRFIGEVSVRYESGGDTFVALQLEHQMKLQKLMEQLSRNVIPVFAKMQADQLKKIKAQTFDRNTFYSRMVDEWINNHALESAKGFAQTTSDDIVRVIRAGVSEGLGVKQISSNIRKTKQLSPYRAETIARTETHNAATFAGAETAKQAEQELGLRLLKEWVPTLDERTRADHADMINHPAIPLNDLFDVGGVFMDRPSDPRGGAANAINCRCVQIIKEVDNDT